MQVTLSVAELDWELSNLITQSNTEYIDYTSEC